VGNLIIHFIILLRTGMELIKHHLRKGLDGAKDGLSMLSPANVSRKLKEVKQLPPGEIAMGAVKLLMLSVYYVLLFGAQVVKKFWEGMMSLMRGPPVEKVFFNYWKHL